MSPHDFHFVRTNLGPPINGFRGAQFEKQCKLFDTLFALLHALLYVKRPDWLGGPPSLLFSGYGCSSPGVERPGHEVNDSPPSVTEVKNELSYAFPRPICFLGVEGNYYFLSFKCAKHNNRDYAHSDKLPESSFNSYLL